MINSLFSPPLALPTPERLKKSRQENRRCLLPPQQERPKHHTVDSWEKHLRPDRPATTPPTVGTIATDSILALPLTKRKRPTKSLTSARTAFSAATLPGKEERRKEKLGFQSLQNDPPMVVELPTDPAFANTTRQMIHEARPATSLSAMQQRALYAQWTRAYEWEEESFASNGVLAEIILLQVFRTTAHLPSPNHLRTAMCCFLLSKLSSAFGRLKGTMNILITEICNALYVNHNVNLAGALSREDADGLSSLADDLSGVKTASGKKETVSFIDLMLYSTQLEAEKKYAENLRGETNSGTTMDPTLLAGLQSEALDLRLQLLRCYFHAWRKHCKSGRQEEGLVAVIQAAKNKLILQGAFRQWRAGIRFKRHMDDEKLRRKLGVLTPEMLSSPVDSEDDLLGSPLRSIHQPRRRVRVDSDLKRIKRICLDTSFPLNLELIAKLGCEGEVIESTETALRVKFSESESVWMPVEAVAPSGEGGTVISPPKPADDSSSEEAEEPTVDETFLLTWVNNVVGKEHGMGLTVGDWGCLAKGDALVVVVHEVVGRSFNLEGLLREASPNWKIEKALSLIPFLSCGVSAADVAAPSDILIPVLLLHLFELWLHRGKKSVQELHGLLGTTPDVPRLIGQIREAVYRRILAVPAHAPIVPIPPHAELWRLRTHGKLCSLFSSYRPVLDDFFLELTQSNNIVSACLTWPEAHEMLSGVGFTPNPVTREASIAAFHLAMGPPKDKQDTNGLNREQFDVLLTILSLWFVKDPSLLANGNLVADLTTFLNSLVPKATKILGLSTPLLPSLAPPSPIDGEESSDGDGSSG